MDERFVEVKIKIFLLLAIFQIHILAQSNGFNEALPEKQIITSTMIKAAGIQSLSGILYLADKWDIVSIDGYQRQATANFLSPFQNQNFIVLLDGQRIDNNIFDVQNINQLPISVNQIDYVEFINTPGIYDGEFAGNGLISIHTKKPKKYFSIHLYNGVGDQTGDPGPYVFTKYASPNVDKLGFYFTVNANEAGKTWYLKASIKQEQNFATSPEINNRIDNLFPFYNKAWMTATYLKFDKNLFDGEQQLMLGNTRHYDFYFFKPYGDEIPVNRYFRFWGIKGNINKHKKLNFDYNFIYSLNELGQWENKQNLDFNFDQEEYYLKFQANYDNSFINSSAGFSIRNIQGYSVYQRFSKDYTLRSLYARTTFKVNKNFYQTINAYYTTDGKNKAIKTAFNNYLIIDSLSSLKSDFSYSERLFSEDANYLFWYSNGYKFKAPNFYSPVIDGNINTRKKFTADLGYSLKLNTRFNIGLSLFFRHFSNFYIESQPYQYFPQKSTFFGYDMVYTDADLKTAGFQISAKYKITPKLLQKIYYGYQKDYWGNNIFREAWRTIPVHKINYTLYYTPGDDFSIWARLRYLSSTIWYDYEYSNIQSSTKYKMKVNPLLNFDVSFSKWFWKKKIFINVLFRNIFNQSEKYIPIGTSGNLRFYLQFQVLLDSIF